MKNSIEQIYDLLETYNFSDLREDDKSMVLQQMSEEEYTRMRSAIAETKNFFSNDTVHSAEKSKMHNIFSMRIEIYKVAIAAAVLIAVQFLYTVKPQDESNIAIAQTDTVYLEKYDTIVQYFYDTVTVERIVVENKPVSMPEIDARNLNATETELLTEKSDINPDDIEKLLRKRGK